MIPPTRLPGAGRGGRFRGWRRAGGAGVCLAFCGCRPAIAQSGARGSLYWHQQEESPDERSHHGTVRTLLQRRTQQPQQPQRRWIHESPHGHVRQLRARPPARRPEPGQLHQEAKLEHGQLLHGEGEVGDEGAGLAGWGRAGSGRLYPTTASGSGSTFSIDSRLSSSESQMSTLRCRLSQY